MEPTAPPGQQPVPPVFPPQPPINGVPATMPPYPAPAAAIPAAPIQNFPPPIQQPPAQTLSYPPVQLPQTGQPGAPAPLIPPPPQSPPMGAPGVPMQPPPPPYPQPVMYAPQQPPMPYAPQPAAPQFPQQWQVVGGVPTLPPPGFSQMPQYPPLSPLPPSWTGSPVRPGQSPQQPTLPPAPPPPPAPSQTTTESLGEYAELDKLKQRLASTQLPPELAEKASSMLNRLALSFKYGGHLTGFDQVANYIDWITALPWTKRSTDTIDMVQAKTILDSHHYGLPEIKERIIEYLSVMKLNIAQAAKDPTGASLSLMRAPVLFFVGLAGTGKTTIAISIAEAMGRSYVRIPFGGMGSGLDLRGESRAHPDAEVGLVIKALRRAGTRNPVILLDELDRIADHARSDIMGVLIELLDPGQNMAFVDHYIDFPVDLSEVLFVATANNTGNISTAVMDRLEPIQMPSYTDEEKIIIAKMYVFPKISKNAGLTVAHLQVNDDVWPLVIRPLGFDSGIRTLERTVNGMCRKVARMIVNGQAQSVRVTTENVKQFLPTW